MENTKWHNFWKYEKILNGINLGDGRYSDEWVKGKELRVFTLDGISTSVTKSVISGLEKFLQDYSLDFRIKDLGNHYSINDLIVYKNKSVDPTNTLIKLGKEPYRQGNPHGDIVIVNRPFSDGSSDWGKAMYSLGGILIYPWDQKSLSFIKKLTVHETHHLFGNNFHCDTNEGVNKYMPKYPNCVMNWTVPTINACYKCTTAMKILIERIEKKHGVQLRK